VIEAWSTDSPPAGRLAVVAAAAGTAFSAIPATIATTAMLSLMLPVMLARATTTPATGPIMAIGAVTC
jgi:hypothetical protein